MTSSRLHRSRQVFRTTGRCLLRRLLLLLLPGLGLLLRLLLGSLLFAFFLLGGSLRGATALSILCSEVLECGNIVLQVAAL